MQNKSSLRKALLAARTSLTDAVRAQWDAAIGNQVSSWLMANHVRVLGVYSPMRNEPDLRTLYAEWSRLGVQMCLPVVVSAAAPLKFIAWKPGELLIVDAMGVSIPASSDAEVWPDALLVPCVGFNGERMRLGYGGGFYDRTLALSPRPRTVGIAYSCTEVAFGADEYDIALDAIITERLT